MASFKPPTPDEIREARNKAGLTQKQAAHLVGLKNFNSWKFYEANPSTNKRTNRISKGIWELFLLKTQKMKD